MLFAAHTNNSSNEAQRNLLRNRRQLFPQYFRRSNLRENLATTHSQVPLRSGTIPFGRSPEKQWRRENAAFSLVTSFFTQGVTPSAHSPLKKNLMAEEKSQSRQPQSYPNGLNSGKQKYRRGQGSGSGNSSAQPAFRPGYLAQYGKLRA